MPYTPVRDRPVAVNKEVVGTVFKQYLPLVFESTATEKQLLAFGPHNSTLSSAFGSALAIAFRRDHLVPLNAARGGRREGSA